MAFSSKRRFDSSARSKRLSPKKGRVSQGADSPAFGSGNEEASERLHRARRLSRERQQQADDAQARDRERNRNASDAPELRLRAPKRARVQLPSTYQTPRGGTDTKGSHPQASSGSDASSLQRAGAPQKSERAPHKHKRLKSTARDSAQTKSATQRKTERKQRERKRHRQGQVIRQVLLAMAVLALVAAAVWGGFELLRSSWFAATTVQIVGAEQLDAGQVRKVAAIAADESVVLLTTSQVRRRLLKNPWIADLHIEKRLPHTIIITIGERSPQAFIKVGEQTWLVSRDGRWLGVYDSEAQLVLDPEGLQAAVPLKSTGVVAVEELATDLKLKPQMGALARGEVLENLLAILRGLTSGLRARVVRAAAADLTRTALFTADGIELDIGRASHLAEKNQIITKILKEQEGKVVLINVRSIEKPTWRGLNQ